MKNSGVDDAGFIGLLDSGFRALGVEGSGF